VAGDPGEGDTPEDPHTGARTLRERYADTQWLKINLALESLRTRVEDMQRTRSYSADTIDAKFLPRDEYAVKHDQLLSAAASNTASIAATSTALAAFTQQLGDLKTVVTSLAEAVASDHDRVNKLETTLQAGYSLVKWVLPSSLAVLIIGVVTRIFGV
jgi:hypothetical protein